MMGKHLPLRVISFAGVFPAAMALAAIGPAAWGEARLGPPAPPRVRPKYQFRAQLDAGPKIEAERKALERLAGAKQWDEWLQRYQKLLDQHPDGLLPAGEDRFVGLRRSLQERFQALPAGVRARYRQQFDEAAAAALARAIERAEPAEVAKVYARFRFTSAGPRAMTWLAERALDGGDPERAWLAFSRLVADAAGPEPELATWMAKAIVAGELAGHHTEAVALSERLAGRLGDRPLKISGRVMTAREWVRSGAGRSAPGSGVPNPDRRSPNAPRSTPSAHGPLEWPDFAGGPDRWRGMLGTAGPGIRLAWQDVVPGAGMGLPDYYDGGRPRWGVASRYPGVSRFSHLPFPTVADGRVYAHSPGSIRCLSLEDGQLIWKVREADLGPQRRFPTPGGFRWWRPFRATQTVPVVAGRLLLVRAPSGGFENDSTGWPAEFVLAALDARTGALLWQRSAGDGPPDSFYNLPAVDGQTVFSGISTAMAGLTEYRACAVDAATGDRLWTTHLGSGSDPMAGVDGSPAAVRGGIVWVETCLHTVAALDALTGEILWVSAFKPANNAPERSGWQDTMNVTNEPVGVLAPLGERLLFSPRWANQAVALNARTGHRAWSIDSERSRILIAVSGSRALLMGDELRSIDPATGRPQWSWTPPDRNRVGYPALVGGRVVVPQGSAILFLDAESGNEVGRRSLRGFDAQPGAATVLVLGRRLLFSQPDRLIAVDETPGESLARLW